MPKYIAVLEVHNDHEWDNPPYFAVELTPKGCQEILSLMNEIHKRDDVDYVQSFNYQGEYAASHMDDFEGDSPERLLERAEEDSERTECNLRTVSDDDVWWSAEFKHSNVQMYTDRIPRNIIAKIASGDKLMDEELSSIQKEL